MKFSLELRTLHNAPPKKEYVDISNIALSVSESSGFCHIKDMTFVYVPRHLPVALI
jgi:hypothetical protein